MTLKEWLDEEKTRWSRRRSNPPRGTQDWLALKLGVDQGQVSKWVRRISAPTTYAARIVRLSGGKVTLGELERVK
jgi:hypothetical protein